MPASSSTTKSPAPITSTVSSRRRYADAVDFTIQLSKVESTLPGVACEHGSTGRGAEHYLAVDERRHWTSGSQGGRIKWLIESSGRDDDQVRALPGSRRPRSACRPRARVETRRAKGAINEMACAAGRLAPGSNGSRRTTATAMPGHGSAGSTGASVPNGRPPCPPEAGQREGVRGALAPGEACCSASLRRWTGWTDAATPSRRNAAGRPDRPAGRARSAAEAKLGAREAIEDIERHAYGRVADRVHLGLNSATPSGADELAQLVGVGDEHAGGSAGRRIDRRVGVRRQQRRTARSERTVAEELQPADAEAADRAPLRSSRSSARSSCGARTHPWTRSGRAPRPGEPAIEERPALDVAIVVQAHPGRGSRSRPKQTGELAASVRPASSSLAQDRGSASRPGAAAPSCRIPLGRPVRDRDVRADRRHPRAAHRSGELMRRVADPARMVIVCVERNRPPGRDALQVAAVGPAGQRMHRPAVTQQPAARVSQRNRRACSPEIAASAPARSRPRQVDLRLGQDERHQVQVRIGDARQRDDVIGQPRPLCRGRTSSPICDSSPTPITRPPAMAKADCQPQPASPARVPTRPTITRSARGRLSLIGPGCVQAGAVQAGRKAKSKSDARLGAVEGRQDRSGALPRDAAAGKGIDRRDEAGRVACRRGRRSCRGHELLGGSEHVRWGVAGSGRSDDEAAGWWAASPRTIVPSMPATAVAR